MTSGDVALARMEDRQTALAQLGPDEDDGKQDGFVWTCCHCGRQYLLNWYPGEIRNGRRICQDCHAYGIRFLNGSTANMYRVPRSELEQMAAEYEANKSATVDAALLSEQF